MAGGSGTRFWPASRARRPKQLLPLGGGDPLLVRTSRRLAGLIPPDRQMVVTGARHIDAVRALLPEVPPEQIVGEPQGRDTAACVGLSAVLAERIDPDAIVVAMPSDHVIEPEERFRGHLAAAATALTEHPESILVFGIEPDRPATGFGYLRCGEKLPDVDGCPLHRLEAFVEKPDATRAQLMLDQGGHLWNAGLFAFRPATLIDAYRTHLPHMLPGLQRIAAAWGRDEFEPILAHEFPKLEKTSIDFGVMEKIEGALLMPLSLQWDDVGAWSALPRLREADEDGNVTDGDVVALEATGNILAAPTGGVVAVRGIDDLVVVHTADATLVCRRDDAEGVKQITEALKARGLERFL